MIKTCLGKDYFLKNDHPRLRAARGMIFLKEMELAEFYRMGGENSRSGPRTWIGGAVRWGCTPLPLHRRKEKGPVPANGTFSFHPLAWPGLRNLRPLFFLLTSSGFTVGPCELTEARRFSCSR